jgi:hypothetical protein
MHSKWEILLSSINGRFFFFSFNLTNAYYGDFIGLWVFIGNWNGWIIQCPVIIESYMQAMEREGI